MIRAIKLWLGRRELDRKMGEFDARIEAARKAHKPVAHIIGQKKRWVHEAMRKGAL